MKADQRFNTIISKVEDYLGEEATLKARDIANKIAQDEGLGYRDFNTILQFLMGIPFLEYVKRRKMIIAYEVLISDPDNYDLDYAINISGYGDANSFSKAFKNNFNMTPKTAFEKQDRSLIEAPPSWEQLSTTKDDTQSTNIEEDKTMGTTYLGISKQEFQMITKARDLQLLYQFNDEQTDASYRIAKRNNISLKKAFDYVEAYCIYQRDLWAIIKHEFDEDDANNIVLEDDLVYAYCNLGLPISEALSIRDEIRPANYKLTDIDQTVLGAAKYHPDIPYATIVKCYEDLGSEDCIAFSAALCAIDDGFSFDEAIKRGIEYEEALLYGDDYDDLPVRTHEDEMDDYFEEREKRFSGEKEENFFDRYEDTDWDDIPDEEKYEY